MKKYLIISLCLVLFLLGFSLYQAIVFNDGKLHVTICDVGQGDAVVMRTPDQRVILFDGGPDKKVLGCLNRAMPYWERHIDLMILSHPHADHLNGLVDVLRVYSVRQFATEELDNTSDGYKALEQAVKKEGLVWQILYQGDRIKISHDISLNVIWPTREYISTITGDGAVVYEEVSSLELLLSYKDFRLLLTGDSQHEHLEEALRMYPAELSNITVLQEPHHGSRTGITPEIIQAFSPQLVTISVGAKNTYGHPASNVISILQDAGVLVVRTDKEGDLKLITDGKSYNLK